MISFLHILQVLSGNIHWEGFHTQNTAKVLKKPILLPSSACLQTTHNLTHSGLIDIGLREVVGTVWYILLVF